MHRRLLASLSLLVVLLASTSAQAAPPVDDRIVYVHFGDAGTTVYQWFPLPWAQEQNDTLALPVPKEATDFDAWTVDGRAVGWLLREDGVLQVARPGDATALQVVAHDAPTKRIQIEDEGRADVWILVATEAGRRPTLDATWEEVDAADVEERALMPGSWPVDRTSTYWVTAGPLPPTDLTIGTRSVDAPAPYAGWALGVGVLVILLIATVWLFARVHATVDDPTRKKQLPWLEHLEELRRRIIRIALTVGIASIFFFTFGFRFITVGLGALADIVIPVPFPTIFDNAAAQLFSWLAQTVVPPGVQVVVITPWDAVVTQITIAAALGVLVTFPVLFYQIYAFLAPGLYAKERRAVLTTVPVSVLLFLGGALFGILGMMPFLVDILYGFAGTLSASALLNVHDLVLMAVLMGVAFGLSFQLPVVMALTAHIGLVKAATYRKYWRHATVAIFFVAMVITDPTVISQIIVGSLLMVLYGIGLVLAHLFEKRAIAAQKAEAAAETT